MNGKELAGWLAKNKMNQSQLAEKLDVDRSTVCRWLADECRIPKAAEISLTVLTN